MKHQTFIFSVLLLFTIGFLSSCEKKECPDSIDDTELKPCDFSNVDTGLEFELDTLWNKQFDVSLGTSIVKFSDKYIMANNSTSKKYVIYSKEDGAIIREIGEKIETDDYINNLKIIGDYIMWYSSIYSESKIIVKRYNILTGELITTDSIETDVRWSLAFEEDYFYYANDNAVIKTNYNLSFRDTVYKFDKKFNSIFKMELYEYPPPMNKKDLIILYNLEECIFDKFGLIDIYNEKLDIYIDLGTLSSLYEFSIDEDMVNISGENIVFSYNLKDNEYFNLRLNYIDTRKVYSISHRQTPDGDKYPVIFFKKHDQFEAYDLHSGKVLWTCPLNGMVVNSMVPVDLYDEYDNHYIYMLYSINNNMGLVDPYTGVVKYKFPKGFYYYMSPVFDNNIIYLWSASNIVKIKIVKK